MFLKVSLSYFLLNYKTKNFIRFELINFSAYWIVAALHIDNVILLAYNRKKTTNMEDFLTMLNDIDKSERKYTNILQLSDVKYERNESYTEFYNRNNKMIYYT